MKAKKDIQSILDETPKYDNIKRRAKWVASAMHSVDLEDDSVKTALLSAIELAKKNQYGVNWNGSVTYLKWTIRNVRWMYKYFLRKEQRLGLDMLRDKKNFLEVLSLLTLWTSSQGNSELVGKMKLYRKYT